MFEKTGNASLRHAVRRAAGFTLVELLVVIGIIALLISILLPVLNKARSAAQAAACLSNQRQILAAILMYANDHKQYLPGPCLACVNNPAIVNAIRPSSTSSFALMDVWNTTASSSGYPGYYASRELSHMNLLQRYVTGPGYAGVRIASYTVGNTMNGTEVLTGMYANTVWRCPAASSMWETATAVSTSTYFGGKALGYGYIVNNNDLISTTYPAFLFGSYTSTDTVDQRTPKRIPTITYQIKDATNANVVAQSHDSTKIWLVSDLDGRNFSTTTSGAMGIVTGTSTDGLTAKNARQWQPVHRNSSSVVQGETIPSSLGRNYGYLDGHAAWVPYGEWPASSSTSVN